MYIHPIGDILTRKRTDVRKKVLDFRISISSLTKADVFLPDDIPAESFWKVFLVSGDKLGFLAPRATQGGASLFNEVWEEGEVMEVACGRNHCICQFDESEGEPENRSLLASVAICASTDSVDPSHKTGISRPCKVQSSLEERRVQHSGIFQARVLTAAFASLASFASALTLGEKAEAAAAQKSEDGDDEDEDGGSSDFEPSSKKAKGDKGKASLAAAGGNSKKATSGKKKTGNTKTSTALTSSAKAKPSASSYGVATLPHKKLLAWAKKVFLDKRALDAIQEEEMDGATFKSLDKVHFQLRSFLYKKTMQVAWISRGLTPAPVRRLLQVTEELEEKLKLENRRKGGASAEYISRVEDIGRIEHDYLRRFKLKKICIELDLELSGLDELGMLRNIEEFVHEHDPKATLEYPPKAELLAEEETKLQYMRANPPRADPDSDLSLHSALSSESRRSLRFNRETWQISAQALERMLNFANKYMGNEVQDLKGLADPNEDRAESDEANTCERYIIFRVELEYNTPTLFFDVPWPIRFKDRGVDMQDGMFPKSLKGLAAPQEENKKTTASAAKPEPTQANGEEDEYDQDEEAWDC
eukprot:jgi/Bigna1/81226/fgenesh1_pg.78_\